MLWRFLPPPAQADTEFLQERERQLGEWRDWAAAKAEWVAAREAFVREMLGERLAAHEQFTLQEAEVSVVLDVKEEPANKM